MDIATHPTLHPDHEQPQNSSGTFDLDSPGNIPQQIETEPSLQLPHISPTPQRSILRNVSHRILPASFMMLFLLAGTIVMIYSVVLHIALPSIPAIAVAIAFGVIIMLFLFTLLLAYFLELWRPHSREDTESRTESEEPEARRRRERFKESLRNPENPRLAFGKSYGNGNLEESFTERLRESWDTWIGSHAKCRGWTFAHIWRCGRENNVLVQLRGKCHLRCIKHIHLLGHPISPTIDLQLPSSQRRLHNEVPPGCRGGYLSGHRPAGSPNTSQRYKLPECSSHG
jgi:hypothetical protein